MWSTIRSSGPAATRDTCATYPWSFTFNGSLLIEDSSEISWGQRVNKDQESLASRPAVSRADGVTESERYLKKLCERTFLSLWSYPNVYRDQGGTAGGDGKEICDLLVVFENHVIVFSDKDCAFPDSGDLTKDWRRWFRKAVKKSADQVWGAERWIRSHPDRLFTDRPCEHNFPIDLPDLDKAVFHRIVVAHDSSHRCRREFNGGSGSLMISTAITGTAHYEANPRGIQLFTVGDLNPEKGYVHVLDDTSLEIVLGSLDTITDFVEYLTKKEALMRSGCAVEATGEEDLLAFYLSDIDENEQHAFMLPPNPQGLYIEEGYWEWFSQHPQRHAQLEANRISYAWDALIEQFSEHIIGGTQYYASHDSVGESEKSIRLLAREPRTRRRMLATGLLEVIDEKLPEDGRRSRHILPSRPGDPYYVFLTLWRPESVSYEDFRKVRRRLLEWHCMVLKTIYPDAEDIVGIATEDRTTTSRSEDVVYLDARWWNEDLQSEALSLQEKFGILREYERIDFQVQEYPDTPTRSPHALSPTALNVKGRDRNLPCPCGSGTKFKKCCGRNT